MKYLEDAQLNQLTSELTDAVYGNRVVNGRAEVYSMKRAGTDKKYAHALGERYVEELEEWDDELAQYHHLLQRAAAHQQTTPAASNLVSTLPSASPPRLSRKRSQSVGLLLAAEPPETNKRKARASSFDSSSAANTLPSALGDFHETQTRRLLSDLILTLNLSFPDYDFGNVRPTHFQKLSVEEVRAHVNERLSEVASTRPAEGFLTRVWNTLHEVISLSQQETVVYKFTPSESNDTSFLTQTLVEEEDATPLWSFVYFFVNRTQRRILLFCCVETMEQPQSTEEDVEEYNKSSVGYSTDAAAGDVDFDLDPAADVAGGIPLVMSL